MEAEIATEAVPVLADVQDCHKNPHHDGFYSLEELSSDILTEVFQNEDWVTYIREFSKRVVRLSVKKGNITFYGSGFVTKDTTYSDSLYIQTNHNIVKSQEDVSNCTVDCFYDTEDMKEVEKSYGHNYCLDKKDMCMFTFRPVPQKLRQIMSEPIVKPTTGPDNIILIAHPHGGPKKVTIGKHLTGEIHDGVYKYIYTAKSCKGSSGGLVINPGNDKTSYPLYYYCHISHCEGRKGEGYDGMSVDTGNVGQSVWNIRDGKC